MRRTENVSRDGQALRFTDYVLRITHHASSERSTYRIYTDWSSMNPKLRSVEVRPFADRGRPAFLLRDPLALSDKVAVLPQALGPLLVLMDGSRDVSELHAALLVRAALQLSPEVIQHVIDQLDDALLLENDRSAQAYAETLRAYRTAPFRPPSLAGAGYPPDVAGLRGFLDDYLANLSVNGTAPGASSFHIPELTPQTQHESPGPGEGDGQAEITGLVSPHIDYQRGGPIYAGVWERAASAVRAADLVIIFGTDHAGSNGRTTLTRQNYATPYGVLPTDTDLVDAIADAVGDEAAFAEEIHHRGEHSIELAAVWLHHQRDGRPCQVVPILCGSFQHFVEGEADPATDPTLDALLDVLRTATATGRRTLVVAAADLAHVGPAFSDLVPIDRVRYGQLRAADEIPEGDRRNICGLPPIYLTLRLLSGNARGELTGYDRCPADGQHTSFVSVCGMVFHSQEIGRSGKPGL
jgi:AmmeMemoRadiSam system protein B